MAVAPRHAELNEQINAYLDGELDGPTRAAFEQHLHACPTCQVELEQLRATRAALQALLPLRAPRPMTITAPATPDAAAGSWLARWLPWTWRLGSFAAAVCLLIAVVTAVLPARPGVPSLASTSAERAVAPAGGAATQQAAQGSGPPVAGRQNAP
ncbi:MAG TPA: zf-HC2 domain-containing protein, partial [Dehalococcoidia bacterium]